MTIFIYKTVSRRTLDTLGPDASDDVIAGAIGYEEDEDGNLIIPETKVVKRRGYRKHPELIIDWVDNEDDATHFVYTIQVGK